MRIANHTFLVSGGSSGLGAACARLLEAEGGNVVIADINQRVGEHLAAELGARARFVATDVTDEGSVQNAVAVATQAFGGLHGAITCAGIGLAERSKKSEHRSTPTGWFWGIPNWDAGEVIQALGCRCSTLQGRQLSALRFLRALPAAAAAHRRLCRGSRAGF